MTARRPCPPAPSPLEAHAAQFDVFFPTLASAAVSASILRGYFCHAAGPRP